MFANPFIIQTTYISCLRMILPVRRSITNVGDYKLLQCDADTGMLLNTGQSTVVLLVKLTVLTLITNYVTN
jgi:hypothetical protein